MYKLLHISDKNEWNRVLHLFPPSNRDVYFTPEYYSLYERNGDGKACCFVYEEEDEKVLYPFLLNSINQLGYELDDEYYDIQGAYGYNGIITSSKKTDFIARFHDCFDKYCQERHIIAEFSRFHPLLNNQTLASPKMQTFYSRKTVKLDLSLSIDDIWMNQFSTKNRNVIRKAEKEEVTIVESQDYELFQQLYDQTMRNVNAEEFYFFPQRYYDDFKKTFGEDVILCFAMYEGNPIAGSMFMFSQHYAHYHLSARDKNYHKIAGNNVVLWYGIQKAKERGCKWFHFGGGTTSADDDMLLHFKRNFSKENGEFWVGKRVHNQTVYDQIVEQWKRKYPVSYEHNKVKLLGYREIKKTNMNKVLCVAVHADDETLGCGGTMLKHKAQGDEIHWLLLTGPTENHPSKFKKEFIENRARMVNEVANAYGYDSLDYLALPTQLLHTLDLRDIIKQISDVMKRIQPNIIYTMFANDVHSDHRVAFDAVYSCTKSFRYPFIERIYMMETLSETEFALATPARTFLPNVYVNITDYIDRKLEIMQMYPKEVMEEPYPRSLSSIKALARVRGSRAGVMYAEAFQLLYEKR